MLKSRVLTAVVLLVLLAAALFLLPTWAWTALVVVMVMQGTVEWSRLSCFQNQTAKIYWALTLLIMLLLLWLDYRLAAQGLWLHLVIYLCSAIFWLLVVPMWLMVGWRVKQPVIMALTGWTLLIPTAFAMLDLREMAPTPWLLLAVMCLVWVADSAAYFAGRRFGRNKLAPKISPGKTWEGVIGALAGVSLYVMLLWAFNDALRHSEAWPFLLLAGWWWVGLAVIGDLFESAIKRQAGLKDSGALLPGHGGLLDRIDALTSTLPLAAMAILVQQL